MLALPTFEEEIKLWKNGYNLVIGVDEVGRGSFAGPVVASACTFAPNHSSLILNLPPVRDPAVAVTSSLRIDDSKRLKPQERSKAAVWIRENCLAFGIGEVGVNVINKVGIGKAAAQAMRLAVASIMYQVLSIKKENKNIHNTYYKIHNTNPFLLVDAYYVPYLKGIPKVRQRAIIKGDQKSISIAAASIIAKVYRDALMARLSKEHKVYGWGSNKGYGTRDHQEAIKKNGITKLHRIAFVETFLASQGLALRS